MARNTFKDGMSWGAWRLETKTRHLVLTWKNNPEHYYILLDEITTCAKMLDWIFQLRAKSWVTNDIIGDLVSAFDDLFDPQANLCSGGMDKSLNARERFDRLLK